MTASGAYETSDAGRSRTPLDRHEPWCEWNQGEAPRPCNCHYGECYAQGAPCECEAKQERAKVVRLLNPCAACGGVNGFHARPCRVSLDGALLSPVPGPSAESEGGAR